MVNLQKVVSIGLNYTKNGCRLLCKKSSPDKLTEIVEIATQFGRGKTVINSSFSKNGKLVNRTFTRFFDGKKISETIQTFEYEADTIKAKTINNGTTASTTSDVFFKQPNKSLTRIRFQQTPNPDGSRFEHQIYEQLSTKKRGRFIETTTVRLKDGQVTKKTFKTNIKNPQKIKSDPYLYIRNYDDTDFIESASYIVAGKQKVSRGRLIIKKDSWIRKLLDGISLGSFSPLTKAVTINPEFRCKAEVINTLNHEYRHKYQHEKIFKYIKSFFNLFRHPRKQITFTEGEKSFAIECKKAYRRYPLIIFTKKGQERYANNFLEIDANQAGFIGEETFNKMSQYLAKLFKLPQDLTFCDYPIIKTKAFKDTLQKLCKEGDIIPISDIII